MSTEHDHETSCGITWRLEWGKGPFSCSEQRAKIREQIIADPHDRTLREVYADLAIEEGDPHGEVVRLALLLKDRVSGSRSVAQLNELG